MIRNWFVGVLLGFALCVVGCGGPGEEIDPPDQTEEEMAEMDGMGDPTGDMPVDEGGDPEQ